MDRLVYAVCSLQPEEGPGALQAMQESGLQLSPFTPGELATLPEARTEAGHLRTHPGLWPQHGGMDGFFAARAVKP